MGNQLGYPEVDLSGKVALVTGGNTGIGYETAKGLARLGAHTFIACRSKERAEKAINNMKYGIAVAGKSNVGNETKESVAQKATTIRGNEVKIEYLPLDLGSFQSTKECVRLFKERDLPLHILVNNAGVCAPPHSVTGDGIETQFQINHLGPMLLTLELLPTLIGTASFSGDVRVLFVTSDGHFRGDFNPGALNVLTADQYGRMGTYLNTKLYNVMTGYYLQRKLLNKNITFSSPHPGFVNTEIGRNVQDWSFSFLFNIASTTLGRTCVEGAATSLNCAVNPELNSQQHRYYESCKVRDSSETSRNEQLQDQLWEESMKFLKDHCSADIWNEYRPRAQEFVEQHLEVPTEADLAESAQMTETPSTVDSPENTQENSSASLNCNSTTAQIEDVKNDSESTEGTKNAESAQTTETPSTVDSPENAQENSSASLNCNSTTAQIEDETTEGTNKVSNTEEIKNVSSNSEDTNVSNAEDIEEVSNTNNTEGIKEASEDEIVDHNDRSAKQQDDIEDDAPQEANKSQHFNGSVNGLRENVKDETSLDNSEANDSEPQKAP